MRKMLLDNKFNNHKSKEIGPLATREIKTYPSWVCFDCARKAGGKEPFCPTMHEATCPVCERFKMVTEPRDFGYPAFRGFAKPRLFNNLATRGRRLLNRK